MGKNSDLPVSNTFLNYDIAANKRKTQNGHLPRALVSETPRKLLTSFPQVSS